MFVFGAGWSYLMIYYVACPLSLISASTSWIARIMRIVCDTLLPQFRQILQNPHRYSTASVFMHLPIPRHSGSTTLRSEAAWSRRGHVLIEVMSGRCYELDIKWRTDWIEHLTPWFRWFRVSSCQLIHCISRMSTSTLQQQRFFSAVWHDTIMMLYVYLMIYDDIEFRWN